MDLVPANQPPPTAHRERGAADRAGLVEQEPAADALRVEDVLGAARQLRHARRPVREGERGRLASF